MIEPLCIVDIKNFEYTNKIDEANLMSYPELYIAYPSYVKYYGEKALCAGGLVPASKGVYTAWSIVSETGKKHPVATLRALMIGFNKCKERIKDAHRIQSIALPEDFAYNFDISLGFKFEGIMKSYFGPGMDAYMMGMELNGDS